MLTTVTELSPKSSSKFPRPEFGKGLFYTLLCSYYKEHCYCYLLGSVSLSNRVFPYRPSWP